MLMGATRRPWAGLAVSPRRYHQHKHGWHAAPKGVINSLAKVPSVQPRSWGAQGHGNRSEQVHDPGGQSPANAAATPVICQHVFRNQCPDHKPLFLHGAADSHDAAAVHGCAPEADFELLLKCPSSPGLGIGWDASPIAARSSSIIAHGRNQFPFRVKPWENTFSPSR